MNARGLSAAISATLIVATGAARPTWGADGEADAQCAYLKRVDRSVLKLVRERAMVPADGHGATALAQDPAVSAAQHALAEEDEARKVQDWAALCRYKADDERQRARGAPRVVFMGDSITENWLEGDPSMFSARVLDRGISGQTSSQMLLRFQADVVGLHPRIVHLMAGTNDVAHNTGPISDEDFLSNVTAMIELAQASHIRVVLASIPPAARFPWRPELAPAPRIARLNDRLRALASAHGAVFADYDRVLKAGEGMKASLGNDGVHPNRYGYARMRPVALAALAQADKAR